MDTCRICGVPTEPRDRTYGACDVCTRAALASAEKRARMGSGRATGRFLIDLATVRDKPGHVEFARAVSLTDASRVVREYIDQHALMSSELESAFGYVHDQENGPAAPRSLVAKISYNGRVWTPDGETLIAEAWAPKRRAEVARG